MPTLATVVTLVIQIYEILILIRVLLSWVNANPNRPAFDHPVIRILNQVTDPVLQPIRRLIPPIGGAIDISPIVALILLDIVRRTLLNLLGGL